MIKNKELVSIDHAYFDILETTPFFIVLRSKNTGHYWHLLLQIRNGHQSFFISHKHHKTDSYHPQACRGSIKYSCQYIKEHDTFHLQRMQRKKKKHT